jgi:hypothetical protein
MLQAVLHHLHELDAVAVRILESGLAIAVEALGDLRGVAWLEDAARQAKGWPPLATTSSKTDS